MSGQTSHARSTVSGDLTADRTHDTDSPHSRPRRRGRARGTAHVRRVFGWPFTIAARALQRRFQRASVDEAALPRRVRCQMKSTTADTQGQPAEVARAFLLLDTLPSRSCTQTRAREERLGPPRGLRAQEGPDNVRRWTNAATSGRHRAAVVATAKGGPRHSR